MERIATFGQLYRMIEGNALGMSGDGYNALERHVTFYLSEDADKKPSQLHCNLVLCDGADEYDQALEETPIPDDFWSSLRNLAINLTSSMESLTAEEEPHREHYEILQESNEREGLDILDFLRRYQEATAVPVN
jgi:hypothetical protein